MKIFYEGFGVADRHTWNFTGIGFERGLFN
jgi:hypothetical protein